MDLVDDQMPQLNIMIPNTTTAAIIEDANGLLTESLPTCGKIANLIKVISLDVLKEYPRAVKKLPRERFVANQRETLEEKRDMLALKFYSVILPSGLREIECLHFLV